ncbi:hypothetical protein [Lysinibacillus fusiformis]|jgi:hypothetical protein|uniref:hypothetical protein n=1 Tax=Lysinibacillus fusiformis TaxID=28031 RepID=UPI003D0570BD
MPKAKPEQENAQAKVASEEELKNLPEEEKAAIAEIEAEEGTTGKKYRLSNPDTQYTDVRAGWTIAGEQSKALPENPSPETYQRIKQGFLVEDES